MCSKSCKTAFSFVPFLMLQPKALCTFVFRILKLQTGSTGRNFKAVESFCAEVLSSPKAIQVMAKFGHQPFKTHRCSWSEPLSCLHENRLSLLELNFNHYLDMYSFYRITRNTFLEVRSLRMSETLMPQVAVSTWHK